MYILQLMDYFAATWSLLIIAFCECLVVAWVYGQCLYGMHLMEMK